LGLSEGTLSSQLTRGRRLLATRLARRGVSLSGGALAVALSVGEASAAVPAPLLSATVRAAAVVAAGQAAAATPAALLMNEVLRAMLMTKLKLAVAGVMLVALLGTGSLLFPAAGQAPPADKVSAGDRPLSELELLRREVEILKLQMEVLQSEVRALRGHGAPTGGGNWAKMPAPDHAKKDKDDRDWRGDYRDTERMPAPKDGKAYKDDRDPRGDYWEKVPAPKHAPRDKDDKAYPDLPKGAWGKGPPSADKKSADPSPYPAPQGRLEDELIKLRDMTRDKEIRDKLDHLIKQLRERNDAKKG
jgi:hypothetical protein